MARRDPVERQTVPAGLLEHGGQAARPLRRVTTSSCCGRCRPGQMAHSAIKAPGIRPARGVESATILLEMRQPTPALLEHNPRLLTADARLQRAAPRLEGASCPPSLRHLAAHFAQSGLCRSGSTRSRAGPRARSRRRPTSPGRTQGGGPPRPAVRARCAEPAPGDSYVELRSSAPGNGLVARQLPAKSRAVSTPATLAAFALISAWLDLVAARRAASNKMSRVISSVL